ncbi:MAG TPA: efflux RND transporter periplasmic adaptor subunit [Vicinamibacterales bacterium]|nr:efflux RND transporter periplasmic adaptor subunit [Vicinamibacterales bacterium]
MRRSVLVGLAAAALVLLLAGFLWIRRGPGPTEVDVGRVTRQATFESTVSASGQIVATRYADVGASAFGRIVKLNVAEGDHVTQGQVVAEIDPVQARSDVAAAAAQVRALEAEERAAREQVQASQADRAASAARAVDAARTLDRTLDLWRQGLVTASQRDQAQADADAARAQLAAAGSAVARSRQLLDAADRRVVQAVAQQRRAQDVLNKTSIIAPIAGVVTSLPVRLGEMAVVGIQNAPGTTLMTISDLASINAEVKVAEADILQVKVGQPAGVTLEALPGRTFAGHVIEVGASALPVIGAGTAAREFRVVVRLEHPAPGLKPGLTCDAEILTSRRTNVLTVPLQAVVLRPGAAGGHQRAGVFVADHGTARFAPVTTGIIGGLDIEVSGVRDGTPVVTGPYQVLRELIDGASIRAKRQETS